MSLATAARATVVHRGSAGDSVAGSGTTLAAAGINVRTGSASGAMPRPALRAAFCTAKSRSICEQRPRDTGSTGLILGVFQWVRSRMAAIVVLVVPTSFMI